MCPFCMGGREGEEGGGGAPSHPRAADECAPRPGSNRSCSGRLSGTPAPAPAPAPAPGFCQGERPVIRPPAGDMRAVGGAMGSARAPCRALGRDPRPPRRRPRPAPDGRPQTARAAAP